MPMSSIDLSCRPDFDIDNENVTAPGGGEVEQPVFKCHGRKGLACINGPQMFERLRIKDKNSVCQLRIALTPLSRYKDQRAGSRR